MTFSKTKRNSLREAPLHKIVDKIRIRREEVVVISEAATAVTKEDSGDLDHISNDLDGKMKSKTVIRLENHNRIIFDRKIPAANLRFCAAKSKFSATKLEFSIS